jgi:hypothetical protein
MVLPVSSGITSQLGPPKKVAHPKGTALLEGIIILIRVKRNQ